MGRPNICKSTEGRLDPAISACSNSCAGASPSAGAPSERMGKVVLKSADHPWFYYDRWCHYSR
jgi:hypothetical protein